MIGRHLFPRLGAFRATSANGTRHFLGLFSSTSFPQPAWETIIGEVGNYRTSTRTSSFPVSAVSNGVFLPPNDIPNLPWRYHAMYDIYFITFHRILYRNIIFLPFFSFSLTITSVLAHILRVRSFRLDESFRLHDKLLTNFKTKVLQNSTRSFESRKCRKK